MNRFQTLGFQWGMVGPGSAFSSFLRQSCIFQNPSLVARLPKLSNQLIACLLHLRVHGKCGNALLVICPRDGTDTIWFRWFFFSLYTFKHLKTRPGPPLPEGASPIKMAWSETWTTLKRQLYRARTFWVQWDVPLFTVVVPKLTNYVTFCV